MGKASSSAYVNVTVIYRFDIRDCWYYTSAHGTVGEHLLNWNTGSGNSFISISGFGILKQNPGEIRDWKYGRRWNHRDCGIVRNLGSGLRDWRILLGTLTKGTANQWLESLQPGSMTCSTISVDGESKKKQRMLDLKYLYHGTSWSSRKG